MIGAHYELINFFTVSAPQPLSFLTKQHRNRRDESSAFTNMQPSPKVFEGCCAIACSALKLSMEQLQGTKPCLALISHFIYSEHCCNGTFTCSPSGGSYLTHVSNPHSSCNQDPMKPVSERWTLDRPLLPIARSRSSLNTLASERHYTCTM